MKISVILVSVVGTVTVSAQGINFPADLPECGRTCANNMQGQHADIGCGQTDFACLCRNATYGYGIHDCSQQFCGDDGSADASIHWAVNFCSEQGVAIALPLTNGTNVGTGSSGSGGSASGSPTSDTASPSSGTATSTDSASSASASASSASESASSASASASDAQSTVSSIISSVTSAAGSEAASITSAAGSLAGSITSDAGSLASSLATAGSSAGSAFDSAASESVSPESSTGYAPQMTAAPMAGIFIAGFAAALL